MLVRFVFRKEVILIKWHRNVILNNDFTDRVLRLVVIGFL